MADFSAGKYALIGFVIGNLKFNYKIMNLESKKFKIFESICSDNNIEIDLKRFYKFCNRASYFNWQADKLFYEYAPLELHRRSNYSINHLFDKFNKWSKGEKQFLCWVADTQFYSETIETETINKAKYIYSKEQGIPYFDVRCQEIYSDCL